MAESGDLSPKDDRVNTPVDDHDDDLIGFASPASLQGRRREPTPPPAPEPEADLFDAPDPEPADPEPPVEADAIFAPTRPSPKRKRHHDEDAPAPAGGINLYAVYALILFAVPTVGVSAAIGLFAVTGRPRPEDDLSASHFIYQQRTLWAAAVAAVAGVILLAAPFALGVPILFALALWMVLRGAWGVWALKSGREIDDPLGWWI